MASNRNFFQKLKSLTFTELIYAILFRLFYIYPIRLLSPIFFVCFCLFIQIISPWKKIIISSLISERIGHLSIDVDLFVRKKQLNPNNKTYIFFAGTPCNRQLLRLWQRHLYIIENNVFHNMLLNTIKWWEKTPYYESLEHKWADYDVYQKTQSILKFNSKEKTLGNEQLKKFGIDPEHNWYICIFARESTYLNKVFPRGNWEYHNYRNSNINNLKLASEYIISLGGYVVRIGSHVKNKFEFKNPKVIDYAVKYRSDFMDIFLISNCRFIMGSMSGICDLSQAFDIPYLGLNTIPICEIPFGRYGLFIPKKIKLKKENRYIHFSKLIQDPKFAEENNFIQYWESLDYEVIENTSKEILDATKEMVLRLENKFYLNKKEKYLLKKYYLLYPDGHTKKKVRTPIAIEYLKNNTNLFF